jgi:hypothetical protein
MRNVEFSGACSRTKSTFYSLHNSLILQPAARPFSAIPNHFFWYIRKRGPSLPRRNVNNRHLCPKTYVPELCARIRALLRRGRPEPVSALQVVDLRMDLVRHAVTREERILELTAKEFELLEYLLRHQGHVVSREMLARNVWKISVGTVRWIL